MSSRHVLTPITSFLLCLTVTATFAAGRGGSGPDFGIYEWTEINPNATWAPRAGLQVVSLSNNWYLMGGRTPIDPSEIPVPGASIIWGDVWQSGDRGESWQMILGPESEDSWPARAYFKAVTMGPHIYVMGGQNFNLIENPDPGGPPLIPNSDFFNDVWRSSDGIAWTEMTDATGWSGRAGLSAVVFNSEIFVMGGSANDDSSLGGPQGPERIYFNDVWKSSDGSDWVQVTDGAPWAPRAGARVVVKNGFMYLLGGEEGFICQPIPCIPPYFNDVWRSRDGMNWELVTGEADWPARPGHEVAVVRDHFVLFGGFGLSDDPADPFGSNNPMDIWVSRDGSDWTQVSDSPWNAVFPEEIKYDFATLVAPGGPNGRGLAIYTFGGDREDFDFTDPLNFLNVDNDVWRFSPLQQGPEMFAEGTQSEEISHAGMDDQVHLRAAPNPFNPATSISFRLPATRQVTLTIYDVSGRRVKTLVNRELSAGEHSVQWNGQDEQGDRAASGVYLSLLRAGNLVATKRIVLSK